MKSILKKFYTEKVYVEIIATVVIFFIAFITDSMIGAIIFMLYFIIFLEIIRAVVNYIREQRVILSLLVDAFIILTLREFIINVVKINDSQLHSIDELLQSPLNLNLIVLSASLLFLMLIRYLSVKTSQRSLYKDETETNK